MKTLQQAAQALCDRWDTPAWKDAPHTAVFIGELREAIAREEAQTMEPVAWRQKGADGSWYLFHQATGWKDCSGFEPLFTHPAPAPVTEDVHKKFVDECLRELVCAPATEPVKPSVRELCEAKGITFRTEFEAKPSAGEREVLVKELRESDYMTEFTGPIGDTRQPTLAWRAADMLAADAKWKSRYEQREEEAHQLSEQIIKLREQQVAVPQGYVLAPLDPTPEMVQACNARFIPSIALPVFVAAYKTMLSAAPQPPQADDQCYCDKQGIGKPGVTCGDCPRDYLRPQGE